MRWHWETLFASFFSYIGMLTAFSPIGFLSPTARLQPRRFVSLTRQLATPIKVSQPTLSEVEAMQIKSWSTWGCGASKFPWSYSEAETAYLLKGIVTVIPDDTTLPSVTLRRGDLAVFPAGMSCTWDVKEAISKNYKFD